MSQSIVAHRFIDHFKIMKSMKEFRVHIKPVLRRELKTTSHILIASTFFGLLYPVFGDGFSSIEPYLNGLIIGVTGGLIVSFFELKVFNWKGIQVRFIFALLIKVITYVACFALLIGVILLLTKNHGRLEGFHTVLIEEDYLIINAYALGLVTMVIFTKQMSDKMGQGVLINFVSGKYFQPKEEERIFMFLDVNKSTTIAEEIGHLKFHHFLNDFFHDITECILNRKGEIYQYVGDEVVVTWSPKNGFEDGNCVRTYYDIVSKISSMKEKYESKYGFTPGFKAGFHFGKVIRGEVGKIKSEIVYHGDVVNTAARIEGLCSSSKKDLLLSEDVLLGLPESVQSSAIYLDEIQLRGKNTFVKIFELDLI